MAELTHVCRLEDHWRDQGLRIVKPSARELAKVIERVGVAFPNELLEFFACGTPHDECGEGFRFYPVNEIVHANVFFEEYGYQTTYDAVMFVDYLQESWWYVFWLNGPEEGRVSTVLSGLDQQPSFGTLDDFLAAYLCDDDSLYRQTNEST